MPCQQNHGSCEGTGQRPKVTAAMGLSRSDLNESGYLIKAGTVS